MEVEDNIKNLKRLARVRENQRNSRARKQEHIRDLEQRLAVYKEQAQQKDIQHRLAIQKVEAENKNLRTLLGSLGVSGDLIQQYVTLAGQGTMMDRKVAIPAISATPRPKKEENSLPPCNEVDSRLTSTSLETPEALESVIKSSPQPEGPTPSLCNCPAEQSDAWSSEEDVLNTTLCAIAEDLLVQYNARGTDIEELRRRLWSGFTKGQPGDGCRVQNNILFQVLDEISNGI
ncbi:hypothetical protein N7466_001973 [Penicillium verhagenii]|uniref:uncharacterized protein n=1 Tax=Penicillium verhagenii TaxID=1562060 RepID=UPI0025452703|nr:uncharacterized protein N7466_001973 [Penicillium verhagenii]KAJ5938839.1 hypothetical protein N7466_001973 [Penicillium verhagenii]